MRIILAICIIAMFSACAPKRGGPTCHWADTVAYSYDGVTETKSELFECYQPYGKSGRVCEVIRATNGDPALRTSNCSQ